MIGLLLSSVSASAILAGDDGKPVFTDTRVLLDDTKVPSELTLSADRLTVTNTLGGSDFREWVPAATPIPEQGKYYWEVAMLPTGPSSYNGYVPAVSQEQMDSPADDYDSGSNPIEDTSIGYRGNGSIWRGATQIVGSLPTFGASDVVMIAFEPSSGDFWVGKNGVWSDDPETDPPTASTTPGVFWVAIQGRDADGGGTLRSIPADFDYSVPSGFLPLGRLINVYGVKVDFTQMHVIHGGPVNKLHVNGFRTFVVHGSYAKGPSVKYGPTYVILEE